VVLNGTNWGGGLYYDIHTYTNMYIYICVYPTNCAAKHIFSDTRYLTNPDRNRMSDQTFVFDRFSVNVVHRLGVCHNCHMYYNCDHVVSSWCFTGLRNGCYLSFYPGTCFTQTSGNSGTFVYADFWHYRTVTVLTLDCCPG